MPPSDGSSPGRRILSLWRRLDEVPGGRWLFHRILWRQVPYSGSTGARIVALEPGRTVIELPDRRRVRNHLRSIHALALANVGELASGIAMLTALPPGVRGIVVRMDVEFTKKARGTVRASSRVEVPEVREPLEHAVAAEMRDAEDEPVARVRVVWRLAPREGS